MSEIGVMGSEEFLLGFQLAGINNVFKIASREEAFSESDKIMKMENIGILVMDEKTFNFFPDHIQYKMNKSVKPVVVVISKSLGSTSLRESIIKAIGVDLMK